MFKLVTLLLVITPIFVSTQRRMAGGRMAAKGSAPFQVSLREDGEHVCGGSIITPRAILTAAHCVVLPNIDTVVVGTNQLDTGGQSYGIWKIIAHENYDEESDVNDIALIFTDKYIQFSDKVQPVELNDEPVHAGEPLKVTGWGMFNDINKKVPNDLMELEVNAVLYKECKAWLRDLLPIFKSQICGVANVGQGTCKGDSGGPLVKKNGGKLVGIVSIGILPCATGLPDVYTSVLSFKPWIEKTLSDNDFMTIFLRALYQFKFDFNIERTHNK